MADLERSQHPEAGPLPAGSAAASPSVCECSEALEAAICAISDDDQRRAVASAFAYLRANLLGLQVASPEAGRVMAWVRDTLGALEGQKAVAETPHGERERLWNPAPLIERGQALESDQ